MGIFDGFLGELRQVFLALLPLIVVAVIAHFALVRFSSHERRRMILGFVMTWLGLGLFLQGVIVGFKPVGTFIGETIASGSVPWTLIPLGLVLGTIAALAEPSVLVMSHTVDRVSAGSIPPRIFLPATAIAVGVAIAVAMARALWGIPLLWILIPGYMIAFALTRIAPPAFIGVAFDAGGVATGPVTATFILAISLGAAAVVPGRSAVIDGFGLVALVFLAPVLSLTSLGALFGRQARKQEAELAKGHQTQSDEA